MFEAIRKEDFENWFKGEGWEESEKIISEYLSEFSIVKAISIDELRVEIERHIEEYTKKRDEKPQDIIWRGVFDASINALQCLLRIMEKADEKTN